MIFSDFTQSILAVMTISIVTALGGIRIATGHPRWYTQKRLWLMMAISSGILLGVIFFEFIPVAFAYSNAPVLMLLGIIFILLVETYIAPYLNFFDGPKCDHDHAKQHDHKGDLAFEHQHHVISHQAACSAVGCLVVCAFFDGFQMRAAFMVDAQTGWVTSMALLFHILPDGVLAASLVIAGGLSRKKALIVAFLTGGCVFTGFLIATLLGGIPVFNQAVIPFAAGILIYVTLTHLLPAGIRHPKGFPLILGGALTFYVLHMLLGHIH